MNTMENTSQPGSAEQAAAAPTTRRIPLATSRAMQLALGLAVLAGIAFFTNAFNYPYYEADEGTYLSQAWSYATSGHLSPYYFIYDHIPGGWIMLALWSVLVGGFDTFGNSVNTGRAFMGLLHIGSTLLVFAITLRLVKSRFGASAAALFYALSPLGLYFHRRVLLDNIMIFWVLLAILFLIIALEQRRYIPALLSGLMLGLALAVKEPAIVFYPAAALALILGVRPRRKGLGMAAVMSLAALLPIIPYFAYAWERNELFANGGVSLLGGVMWQVGRGAEGGAGGLAFQSELIGWMFRDSLTISLGAVAIVLILLFLAGRRIDWKSALPVLFAVSYLFFLYFWSNPFEFYVIPLLAFLVIAIGVAAGAVAQIVQQTISTRRSWVSAGFELTLIIPVFFLLSGSQAVYSADQTTSQRQASSWMRANLPVSSFVVIDGYNWVDLHDPDFGKTIPGAHYYWKVVTDPTIRDKWLGDDWQKIDYLAVTPQMLNDMNSQGLSMLLEAYKHSTSVQKFAGTGWEVDIRRVDKLGPVNQGAWDFEDGRNTDWHAYESPDVAPPGAISVQEVTGNEGRYSLQVGLKLIGGAKNAIAETSQPLGDEVTAWMYLPPDAPEGVWALPFIMDSNWKWLNGSGVSLRPGEWVQVSWKIDTTQATLPVNTAGFMFGSNGDYEGPVYVDHIVLNSGAQTGIQQR